MNTKLYYIELVPSIFGFSFVPFCWIFIFQSIVKTPLQLLTDQNIEVINRLREENRKLRITGLHDSEVKTKEFVVCEWFLKVETGGKMCIEFSYDLMFQLILLTFKQLVNFSSHTQYTLHTIHRHRTYTHAYAEIRCLDRGRFENHLPYEKNNIFKTQNDSHVSWLSSFHNIFSLHNILLLLYLQT